MNETDIAIARELHETRIGSRRIYEGRILNLRVDNVRLPDGRCALREVVEHRPAVVIAAENDERHLLLIHQYRYPTGEVILEIPAGIVEPDEDYRDAAIRELREETGWMPTEITRVAECFSSPGFSDELLVMFYATGLSYSKLPQDEDEFILPRFVSAEDAERLAAGGAIRDGKTLFAVYWWLYHKRKALAP